jgi:hypothetical protein
VRLDFGATTDTTFVRITYNRKTYGARYEGHLSEGAGYYLMNSWSQSAGRVAIKSSLRRETGTDFEKACGAEGCKHCPLSPKPWTTYTWHGFEDVADEHKATVEKLGATRTTVEALVEQRNPG